MKTLWISLVILPLFGICQSPQEPSLKLPEWTLSVDLLNVQDNYPALLFGLERQLDRDFAVKLEAGPVLGAETYESYLDLNAYAGYKSRLELKFFYDESKRKRRKSFFGVDIGLQQDFYDLDYSVFRGNFWEIRSGDAKRNVMGTHIRIGQDRFISNDKFVIAWSAGLGRQFFDITYPEENSNISSSISDTSSLDPFSINIRLSIGLVLKQLKEQPLFK